VHAILALLIGSVILDALARPRSGGVSLGLRSLAGTWLLLLIAGAAAGFGLAISGNVIASCAFALCLVGLFTVVSNAKRAMLGEALLFTDLALVGAVFRHPQFYLSALTLVQKCAMIAAAAAVLALTYVLFRPDMASHLLGLGALLGCAAALRLSLTLPWWSRLARVPDHHGDVLHHGLLATILLYWMRWRQSTDPQPTSAFAGQALADELAVVVQCESFADPIELFGDPSLELPGLAAAREHAWQWGDLQVSGFGAYTMRTEYGVLFGRSEEELGFRRFDPLLTAMGETGYALPAQLSAAGWRGLFVHPYDLRFYNRAKIMAAAGFAELLGQDRFAPVEPGKGRYVSDAAIADKVVNLAQDAQCQTLIYAVTIENHGPWKATTAGQDLTESYMRLVRKGDAMLATLTLELAKLKRPTTLVFFGDHRPSIPGITSPTGPRDTPYVIVRLDAHGNPMPGDNRRVDLSPAQLHHALLAIWSSAPEA
jgi:Sulfatase